MYQCGTVPPQEEVDSGRHHLILSVPHTGGVVITETVQIPPIELLGKREEIVGYIGNPKYVSSPCMLHMMNETTIETVFDPLQEFNNTNTAILTANFLAQNPDVIIFGGPGGDKDGDRVVSIAASQERTNVATFDWIALYAALFNLEGTSNRIASSTQASYDCSSSNAAVLAEQRNRDRELQESPTILWAQYFNFGYNWSVAECPTWDTTYYCEYARHCSTTILSRPQGVGVNTPPGSPYWYLNDDEFLEFGKDADIWIYSGNTWDEVYANKSAIMDQFKSVQNERVYDTQGQGSNAWYEQRLAEYDVVGLDMCEIVGTVNPDGPAHVRRWFRDIFTEDIGSLEECRIPEELSEPYVPPVAECTRLQVASSEDSGAVGAVMSMSALLVCAVFAFLG